METKMTYLTVNVVADLQCDIWELLDWRVTPFQEILEIARKEANSLAEIARRALLERRGGRLVTDIEDAVSGLRKAIPYVLELESESSGDGTDISIDEINLKQEVHSFSERVKTIEAKMEEYDAADSSTIASGGGRKSKVVRFCHQCAELANSVSAEWGSMDHGSVRFAICGMAGIGKTTLAKEFFDDRLSLGIDFDCRAWVTVGRNPEFEEIIRSILHQVNPDSDKGLKTRFVALDSNSIHPKKKQKKNPDSDEMLMEGGDENISEYLKDSLRGRRYLIVLDDVWDQWFTKKIDRLLPNNHEESLVLFTTRLKEIAEIFHRGNTQEMLFLDKEDSWNLLREKVFCEEECPFELEEPGKKIAGHCDGLPLTIVTVANLLSQAEKTRLYWDEVAAKKNHQLFKDAFEEMSKVLLPSYENLTQILQFCFLYMGVFPQNYKIPQSKLISMWCTDRFPEQNVDKFSIDDAWECLEKLVSNSLLVIYGGRSIIRRFLTSSETERDIKTCHLHSSFWHLSNREAGKIKFCYVLSGANDGLEEGIEKQRRLSFHNNILFGIKDVYESVEDNCASTAHSLLFYGPYHQYQVPVCFSLELLKQLDALAIRFYEFPVEILQLVELRYLALTVNGKLPASISQLSNLEVLIVGRHMSIKSYRTPSYMPMEIWNMKELQHLQVMGCDLPYPPFGASLENLSTLANVSPLSCSEGILRAIPNLKKLGIRIDLLPDDDGKPLRCFDHISLLERLKSLKCVVENPEFVASLAPLTIFSSCLKKLSFSGLGYSWEEMSKLSSLPRLVVLKLRNYAFRGPKWEVEERGFRLLCSLVIEDTDLEEWKIGSESFPVLERLIIKHCYKLEKILGKFERVHTIELTDCNALDVEQVKKFPKSWGLVYVNFSWNDGK